VFSLSSLTLRGGKKEGRKERRERKEGKKKRVTDKGGWMECKGRDRRQRYHPPHPPKAN